MRQGGFLRSGRSAGLLLLVLAIALLLNLRETGSLWPMGQKDAVIPVLEQVELLVSADCDPVKAPCSVIADGMVLKVSLGPEVKPLQPFQVTVLVDQAGEAVERMELEFFMQGMDMGQNRYRLQEQESGLWQVQAILPVCTTQRVDWIAKVGVYIGTRLYVAEIPFHTN